MELISVKGDMEDINTYVNLYQKFSSIDGDSIEEARRHYMQGELERYKNRVSSLSVEEGGVEEQSDTSIGSTAEATPQREELFVWTDKSSHGVMLDASDEEVKEELFVWTDPPSDEEVDDDSLVGLGKSSHGVMLDTSDEEVEEVSSNSVIEEPRLPHGVMLDELEDGDDFGSETVYEEEDDSAWADNIDVSEEPDETEPESVEIEEDETSDESAWAEEDEDDGSSWGEDEDETSEELVEEEETSDESAWTEEEDDGISYGEEVSEPIESKPPIESYKGSEPQKPFCNSARFTPNKGLSPVPKREVPVPTPKPAVTTKPQANYPNVRAFVKGNPGCTSSDVLKYFSANELKKALLSSKVVTKKGKLYVV